MDDPAVEGIDSVAGDVFSVLQLFWPWNLFLNGGNPGHSMCVQDLSLCPVLRPRQRVRLDLLQLCGWLKSPLVHVDGSGSGREIGNGVPQCHQIHLLLGLLPTPSHCPLSSLPCSFNAQCHTYAYQSR